MKTIAFILALILVTPISHAEIETVLGSVPLAQNANLLGSPSMPSNEIIISRKQYVISYNKERRSPNWVAWKVDARSLGHADRTDHFEQDEELQKYLKTQDPQAPPAVTASDYQGSCFDRGHQAPSADRTNTLINNQATFLMSNMVPQTPFLNRYLWEQLEQFTRKIVAQGSTVYVIAGPIYDQNFGAIGPNNDIPVPSKLFKVILTQHRGRLVAISVVMPNILENGETPTHKADLCKDSAPPSGTDRYDWKNYRSTLSQIHSLTGLNIANIPKPLEYK